MTAIAINWSFAKCSCPSWSASADESALRSALASLDACNSSLHWWFGFWTFLVAFGVALEVIFVVWEYLEELHDLRRCLMHPPRRPNTALFVLGLLGAGLVAAGVSGEFWKESQIATVETCIRKGNDALFLLLSKEAGDAEKSAVNSKRASDDVAATAKDLAEELSRLRGETAARRLSKEQNDSLRKSIEGMPTPIAIGCNPMDSEARDLTVDFFKVMESAHWPSSGVNWIPNGKYGLFVGFVDKEGFDTPQYKLLHDALKGAEIKFSELLLKNGDTTLSPPAQSHVMYLLVGTHPSVSRQAANPSKKQTK